VKPPFAYYGGKQRIATRLVSLMPAHEHYVEPFAGSLSVLLVKPRSPMETVNDLDRVLVTFWSVLRDRPLDLARACALTPHSRVEYEACRDDETPDELETARRIFTRLAQGRGSCTGNPKTGWRFYADPAGSGLSMPDYLDAYVSRIVASSERLRSVSLECRPALDVIASYGQHADVLLYADPPYVRSVRASSAYRHEMDDDDHRQLAQALAGCRATVMLSGYDSPLYDELYAGWHRQTIETATGNGGRWEQRTEVVWSNRPFNEGRLFEVTA
jgi:DNA adenine methylase